MILAVSVAWARPEEVGHVDDPVRGTVCHYAHGQHEEACLAMLGWVDEAWSAQVDGLGFAAPLPDDGEGGSDALDIYLSEEGTGGAGGAYVTCDGEDFGCRDAVTGDGRNGTPSYIVIDPRTDEDQLRQYVHHEFQHVTQYATDFLEPSLALWEGVAVAAERWTDPTAAIEVGPIADYQASPWASSVLHDGYWLDEEYGLWSWYEYGACTWIFWLVDRHGAGADVALWAASAQEGEENEPDVLDAWDAMSGDWRGEMVEFAMDRARMGTAAGPEFLSFAGRDAYAWREGEIVGDSVVAPAMPPYALGVSLWDLEVLSGTGIRLELEGDPAEWAVFAVQGAEGASGIDALDWVAPEQGIVTVGVVNLGPAEFDADDPLDGASFALDVRVTPEAEPPAGCGCAASTPGSGLPLLLVGLAGRRRRRGLPVAAVGHPGEALR